MYNAAPGLIYYELNMSKETELEVKEAKRNLFLAFGVVECKNQLNCKDYNCIDHGIWFQKKDRSWLSSMLSFLKSRFH